MKAMICQRPGHIEIVDRPSPGAPPEGSVAVDIRHVGICGTDYHIFEGKHPFLEYPRVMGHELSGTVERAMLNEEGMLVITPQDYGFDGAFAARMRKVAS